MNVDLNSDLGESYGKYKIGNDAELMKSISSCNIACGFHAGDPSVIRKTVELALENSLTIGAHPGYPDLMGFGRREINLSEEELFDMVLFQVGTLKSIVEAFGGKLSHVKPHGAMYNRAAGDRNTARTISLAVKKMDDELYIMGLSGSFLIEEAKSIGLKTVSEVFADREYENDGKLVPRSKKNAMISDVNSSMVRILNMIKKGCVVSTEGSEIKINAETVCIHGDGEHAVEFAEKINGFLMENGVEIRSYVKRGDI